MSLGGGQTQSPVADSNKYAQIMELMRMRQSMNPGYSYTGGFNSSVPSSVLDTPSSYYDEILRLQRLNNPNSNERGRGDAPTGDGYSPNMSPMSNSINGSGLYGFLDMYGNILGGALPLGFVAQAIAQQMNPGQVENAGKASAQALSDAIAGYTSGEMFGAPPSNPSTFGGAGYGTSTSQGGYGVTGMTGAGVAANPMGIDPATAQGQQSSGGGYSSAPSAAESSGGGSGVSAPSGGMSGYGGSAVSAGGTSSAPGQGPGYGGGYEGGGGYSSPSGGDAGSSGAFGGGFGGGDGGDGGYYKGGKVTMNRLRGPNPMGPDDGYAGLKNGEFVINAKSVGKYGIELMNAINAGKISKGKLRGLLEG